MKLAVLVDYTNLFIQVKQDKQLKKTEEIEAEIYKILAALKAQLEQPYEFNKRKVTLQNVATVCYVIDTPSFGNPEKAFKDLNIKVKRIAEEKKSVEKKAMNQSQDDDSILMRDARLLVSKAGLDTILVVSNDGDFISLGEQLKQLGKLFWVGVYEGATKASRQLRKQANVVIPLHELANQIEDVKAMPKEQIEADEDIMTSPHLEIHYSKKIIMRYPIDFTPIEIGRRSATLFHYPQIDLTEYDEEKIVSRKHATITPVGDRLLFAVNPNSSRGTWRNGKPVYKGEQFFLEPDMRIVIGSSAGFGIRYRPQ